MDTKINLSQLAKQLASKKNISQRSAEAFLREFFDSIIQNVTTDKLVKVKGLGTFKLIEVLDRESINVNSGERIVIPGHTRLSFTPDTMLRDLVNKPFADFQTVVINEGTNIEEMERIDREEGMPAAEKENEGEETNTSMSDIEEQEFETETKQKAEQNIESIPSVEPKQESEDRAKTEIELEPEQEPALESASQLDSEPVVIPESEAKQTSEPTLEPIVKIRALTGAEIGALTLGIILLCIFSYVVGFYRLLSHEPNPSRKRMPKTEISRVSYKTPTTQTFVKDTLPAVPDPAVPDISVRQVNQDGESLAQVPGGRYRIIGTRKTHVMKSGDYLTKMALQEYGNKNFVYYIVVHNGIKNPDNVPVGMVIKLPELEELKE